MDSGWFDQESHPEDRGGYAAVSPNSALCTKLDKIKNLSVEVPSGSVVIIKACTDLLLRLLQVDKTMACGHLAVWTIL